MSVHPPAFHLSSHTFFLQAAAHVKVSFCTKVSTHQLKSKVKLLTAIVHRVECKGVEAKLAGILYMQTIRKHLCVFILHIPL